MKKLIIRMYGVAGILFFFLFLYGLFSLRISIDRSDVLNGFYDISNYSVSAVTEASAPTEEKKIIRFRLKDIKGDNNSLFFLSTYQNVEVYLEDEEIYSLSAREGLLCPEDPGIVYNEITLESEDVDREIRIELEPYFQSINPTPVLRFGEKSEILKHIILRNLPVMILCTIVIFMGVVQFCVALINRKRKDFGLGPALFHSVFIILIGLWKLMDCEVAALFARDFPVISQLSFFIFMSAPIMFTKVVRDQLDAKKEKLWVLADVVSLIGIVALLVLQATGVMGVISGMWIVQVYLAFSLMCVILSLRATLKESGWDKNLKTAVTVTIFGIIWFLVDMISNYLTNGVSVVPFSMFIFLVFLVILVWNRLQISRKGMEEGMQARQYKKLAFHDALTGFFNRAAYMDYLASTEFPAENSVMLAFDLNNLKKCNDELGHEKGDIYIKESAKIIMDCFGENGRCYRLGGDEFSAILERVSVSDCEKRIHRMNERVEKFNQASRDIHMGIACGYAVYDPVEDEDIHATIRRADKMMYEVKFAMKQTARG